MNDKTFTEIKKGYGSFYKDLLRKGKLPLWSTGKGFWGGVIADEVYEAFKKIKLHKHKTFIDLGSGDGKAVLIAALFCKRAVGIEIDNGLYKKSLEMQNKLNIPNAIFFNNDFNDHSISEFDFVFVYPDAPMHRGLEKKLLNELTGKLIHYGHHFHPQNLKAKDKFLVDGNLFTVYTNSNK
ncbi:MAG: hypothetical protein QGI89_04555 [Candidatus Woesearchaeota archaeon]|jgi:16S rRNA G527 N7-methylase RsmG|nr:hypothetical protein [Candidatus Woesearchaeota archaeon]MDP6265823.1 hypothetical protein [Candidatus Woesearchaeota archaeon]MDP7322480.1 hypothetical protein [Candidatus Woesearchaeota archaeon]HJO01998.1 hypothetical protein [Candidatus Woesearchaeota archaeon]|tara:strand:- start:448 stop:990 length:543 start_codon:yes stop_codon:yes gene_type:complete